MKPHRLLNLLSANAKRGAFRADASSNTIQLYDYIVSSEDEAAWFGGVSLQGFGGALKGMRRERGPRCRERGQKGGEGARRHEGDPQGPDARHRQQRRSARDSRLARKD